MRLINLIFIQLFHALHGLATSNNNNKHPISQTSCQHLHIETIIFFFKCYIHNIFTTLSQQILCNELLLAIASGNKVIPIVDSN